MTRDRETARRIAQQVQPLGGSVYYVGGCVRDRLLGRESKDLDIEVHGVTPQQLALGLLAMGGLEVAKIFGNFSGALMALPSLLLTACWLKIIREDGKDLLHTYRAKD